MNKLTLSLAALIFTATSAHAATPKTGTYKGNITSTIKIFKNGELAESSRVTKVKAPVVKGKGAITVQIPTVTATLKAVGGSLFYVQASPAYAERPECAAVVTVGAQAISNTQFFIKQTDEVTCPDGDSVEAEYSGTLKLIPPKK